MVNSAKLIRVIVVVFGIVMVANAGNACAFDICNKMFGMMNKSQVSHSEWNDDSRDSNDYYRNAGDDSNYGYRASGYGHRSPGYGYGGTPVPGYGYNAPVYRVPYSDNGAVQAEIYQLKMRIRSLEKALTRESSRPQNAPAKPGTG
jgi:hypothetical protein